MSEFLNYLDSSLDYNFIVSSNAYCLVLNNCILNECFIYLKYVNLHSKMVKQNPVDGLLF